MTALVRWHDPRTIRVELPGAQECEVEAECYRPVRAVVFYMPSLQQLENRLVCYWHAEQCKAIGRCLIFPAEQAPHPDVVVRAVQQEVARRGRMTYQQTGSVFYGQTVTGAWGSVRFNF